jgi:hypothetical protein
MILLAILVLPIDIATRRIVVPIGELLKTRKKAKTTQTEAMPIEGLKSAKQRAKAKTGAVERTQTSHTGVFQDLRSTVKTETKTQEPMDEPTTPSVSGSTAAALLAKKRNRSEENKD